MQLVRAEGVVLQQILEATHPLWADGLSPHAYARYNDAQMRTPWGKDRLRRYALVDEAGRLLSTAKRYDLAVRLDGREIEAVGLAAVFTPLEERGNGYAPVIIERLIDAARADGAELAILFSEIGTRYYRRLGFLTVPQRELTLSVAEKPRRSNGAGANRGRTRHPCCRGTGVANDRGLSVRPRSVGGLPPLQSQQKASTRRPVDTRCAHR